ncbi:MAG: DUF362 domain-containing protein [Acidobacteria bacterium]|nr:DUF362 domain-containing protein [Acidobacteriota bacterium]
MTITRREFLAVASAAPLMAAHAPLRPVVIAKADSYSTGLVGTLRVMFDQLGGLAPKVRNKTVTIKLNLTGSPALKFEGKALSLTHYSHPRMAGALAHLLNEAGATRIRFVESCWGTAGPLEEYLLDSGWNVRQLQSISSKIEFENTNAIGKGKRYLRHSVPGGGFIFPAYELNHSYMDTDVFVSMAKLKDHATCGITLSMKNIFGITPASIYGDDAGIDDPNEAPTKGRLKVCHFGERQPARIAPAENDPASSRAAGHRMPRITAELNAARPIDIAIVDGIETVTGGEGPWIKGISAVKPGVLLAGFNAVSTDAAAAAVMGYDPRATRGTAPFEKCDNTLLLAEQLGLGSADLKKIPILGVPISEARFAFRRP